MTSLERVRRMGYQMYSENFQPVFSTPEQAMMVWSAANPIDKMWLENQKETETAIFHPLQKMLDSIPRMFHTDEYKLLILGIKPNPALIIENVEDAPIPF